MVCMHLPITGKIKHVLNPHIHFIRTVLCDLKHIGLKITPVQGYCYKIDSLDILQLRRIIIHLTQHL